MLLITVLVIGAANFLWQLGSSSYFVDEVLSIEHALPTLGTVNHVVTHTETTPWTYFWGLHFWLHLTGSQNEWVTRLPSAIAGVALVGMVFWTARAFLDRSGALLAAALTALSPIVLTYAQQVRVYVFVMLAVTAAVGLTVRAVQQPMCSRSLLAAGAAAAVLGLWLHYTAILVVAPLCVWLGFQRNLGARVRAGFVGACLIGVAVELPLLLRQYDYAPNGGLGSAASVHPTSVVQVLETPFNGRYFAEINAFRVLGLAVVLSSMIVLWLWATRNVRQPRLLVALGMATPLAILLAGIAGKDLVTTRYTVVAAPLLLTGIAGAIVTLPRRPALLLAVLAATVIGWGLSQVHDQTNFYPPARESLAYIQAHRRPDARIIIPANAGAEIPLRYYAQRVLHANVGFILGTDRSAIELAIQERRPLWNITEQRRLKGTTLQVRRFLTAILARYRYVPRLIHPIVTETTFLVTLMTPGLTPR